MLKRIYLQRRRILFGSAMLVLTLLIADISQPGGLSIFAGMGPLNRVMLVSLLLAFFSSVAAGFIVLLPSLRPMVEVTGLAALLHTTLLLILPEPLVFAMWDTGYATVALFLLYIMVYMTLYGSTMDRLPTWFSSDAHHVFRTTAAPSRVWRAIVPDVGHEQDHWTGTMEAVRLDPEEIDTVEVLYTLGNGLYERQTVTFLEKRAPRICRYYFIAEASATNAQFSEGVFCVRIKPLAEGGSEVETELSRSSMHLRLALMMWFDDMAGDQAHSICARLEELPDHSVSGHFNRQVRKIHDAKAAGRGGDAVDPRAGGAGAAAGVPLPSP